MDKLERLVDLLGLSLSKVHFFTGSEGGEHARLFTAHRIDPNLRVGDVGEKANSKDFSLIITNASGADAWPIAATNFILMYKQPKDATRSRNALDFFKWSLENGQPQADELHFVPLPKALVDQVEAYWASEIKA